MRPGKKHAWIKQKSNLFAEQDMLKANLNKADGIRIRIYVPGFSEGGVYIILNGRGFPQKLTAFNISYQSPEPYNPSFTCSLNVRNCTLIVLSTQSI